MATVERNSTHTIPDGWEAIDMVIALRRSAAMQARVLQGRVVEFQHQVDGRLVTVRAVIETEAPAPAGGQSPGAAPLTF